MASEIQRLATYHDKTQTVALMTHLNEQRKLSRFCDVVLKVCGEQIFAHSNILASASDYFGSFLGCGQDWPRAFSQKTPQIIEIYIDGNDGDGLGYGEAVRKVVDFMYTSKIDITFDVLNQVSEIAKIMQMNKILEYCENFQKLDISGQVGDELDDHNVQLKTTIGTMTDENNIDNNQQTFLRRALVSENSDEDNNVIGEEYIDDCVKDPDFEAIIKEEQNKKRKRGRPRKKSDGTTNIDIVVEEPEEIDENLCIFLQPEGDSIEDDQEKLVNDTDINQIVSDIIKTKSIDHNQDSHSKFKNDAPIVKSEPHSPKLKRRFSNRIRKVKERPDYITHSIPALTKVVKVEPVDDVEDQENKPIDSRIRYMCKKCNFVCKSISEYKIHKQLMHSPPSTPVQIVKKELNCDRCGFMSKKQHEFKEHMKDHLHMELVCSFCEYQADDKSSFDQHILKHTGELPYFCMICDLRFKNKAQQNAHMPKHSEVKPFLCDVCNSGFKWKHALKSHMITHCETKDHLCDICGFATAHKSMLKAHKLIHSGNTYKCEVMHCTFQATKKQNLKYHMLTHSGEKPHQCEICGQSFSLVKNMKRHKLMHSSDKPLKCDIEECQFGTTRYDKLKEHKLKQHGSGFPPAKKMRLSDYQSLNESQIIHITEAQISEALAATQNLEEGQIIATVDTGTAIIGTVQYAEIDNASGIIQYVTSIE